MVSCGGGLNAAAKKRRLQALVPRHAVKFPEDIIAGRERSSNQDVPWNAEYLRVPSRLRKNQISAQNGAFMGERR